MIDEQRYRALIQQLATGGITGNNNNYMNGGGVGSMMQPKRGLVNGPGGYAGLGYQEEIIEDGEILQENLMPSGRVRAGFRGATGNANERDNSIINAATELAPFNNGVVTYDQNTGKIPESYRDQILGMVEPDMSFTRDYSNFNDARMGNANQIPDRNRGQVIERNPSAPFNRGFTMADVAGPSTIDRFSNSVGPTPNEITDRNRGQIGSNNLAQDLAGVARNTTQTEFDSLVDDDFEEMKGINFRDSPVGLFNRQNNIATGIIDKNITNRAYNAGTPQATAQFLAANNFPIPENLKQFLEVDTTTGKYVSKKSPNNFMSFMSNVPTPFNLAKKGLGAVFGANSNLSRKMRGVNEKTGKANTQAQYEANRDAASKQSRTDKMIDRINKGKTTRSNPRDAGTTKAQKNDISMALQESYRGGGSGGGGGGKSIVCTAMYQTTGLQDWAKAMKVWYIYQKRHLSDAHQEGYHLLFKPFVKGMHKSKIIRAIGAHVAKHRTQELKHIMFNSKSDTLGKIYNNILEPICYLAGKIKSIFKK